MTNTPTPKKEELLAINRDFRNLPDVPSRETLWFFARMSGVTKWPDDWERGKKLQRKHPGAIPAKTELELAAGLWNRIATALRTPRLGETGDDDVVEQLKVAFWASFTNANAGMAYLDHDSMDEMIEAAWTGFDPPARAALQQVQPLIERARAFVTKLDECQPYIDSAFFQMHNHGIPYTGPTYGVELDALRAAIRQVDVGGEGRG